MGCIDYYILHVLQSPPNGAPTPSSGLFKAVSSPIKGDRTPPQLAEQFDAPY